MKHHFFRFIPQLPLSECFRCREYLNEVLFPQASFATGLLLADNNWQTHTHISRRKNACKIRAPPRARSARTIWPSWTFFDTSELSTMSQWGETLFSLSASLSSEIAERKPVDKSNKQSSLKNMSQWLIQWRGEGTEGQSMELRHWEFMSAFRAEIKDHYAAISFDVDKFTHCSEIIQFDFQDALSYHGPIYDSDSSGGDDGNHENTKQSQMKQQRGEPIPLDQVKVFESAMQYVSLLPHPSLSNISPELDSEAIKKIFQYTVERCSLVRNAFQIVSEGNSYHQLAEEALKNGSFDDLMTGGENRDATWSLRLRRYGRVEDASDVSDYSNNGINTNSNKNSRRQARYGKNVRSPLTDERNAIISMADLVKLFRGKVNLASPDCKIYLLEGLKDRSASKMLARVVAQGPKTSIYAPKTRICITTTPLCPIASFTLCNVARLSRRPHSEPLTVLDPFAGSCATLLAAAHITSCTSLDMTSAGCRSVAIEIAHNGYVNRNHIVQDFEKRHLEPPVAIIHGDCMSSKIRDQALAEIGGLGFDVIVTDPPYGIREAMSTASTDRTMENSIVSNAIGDRFNVSDEANPDKHEGENTTIDEYTPPLTQLFQAIHFDRMRGMRLLKKGGRLAAFVPVREGQCIEDCLPCLKATEDAGLLLEGKKEQVLSDILSRWLVLYTCLK